MSNLHLNTVLKAASDIAAARRNPRNHGKPTMELEGIDAYRTACKAAREAGCAEDKIRMLTKAAFGGDTAGAADLTSMDPTMFPETDQSMADGTGGMAGGEDEGREMVKALADFYDGQDALQAACEAYDSKYALTPGEDWMKALHAEDPEAKEHIENLNGALAQQTDGGDLGDLLDSDTGRPAAKAMAPASKPAPKAPAYPAQRQTAMTHSSYAHGATKAAIQANTPEVHAQAMQVHQKAAALHQAAGAAAPHDVKVDHETLATHHEKAAYFHQLRAGKVAAGGVKNPQGAPSGSHPIVKAHVQAHTRTVGGKVIQVHDYNTAKQAALHASEHADRTTRDAVFEEGTHGAAHKAHYDARQAHAEAASYATGKKDAKEGHTRLMKYHQEQMAYHEKQAGSDFARTKPAEPYHDHPYYAKTREAMAAKTKAAHLSAAKHYEKLGDTEQAEGHRLNAENIDKQREMGHDASGKPLQKKVEKPTLTTEHLTKHDGDWKGGGRGYLGHENRNEGTDKALVEAAQHHGFDADQLEAYGKSKRGRHDMDSLSFHKDFRSAPAGSKYKEGAEEEHAAKAYDAIPHADKVAHFKEALANAKKDPDFKEQTEAIRNAKADEPSFQAKDYAERQWSRGGGRNEALNKAIQASVDAHEATTLAGDPEKGRTAKVHEAAAKAHEEAAKLHRASGKEHPIIGHKKSIAQYHDEAAAAHRAMAKVVKKG